MALGGLRRNVGQFLTSSNELMAASLSAVSCADEVQEEAEGAACRDDAAALRLKEVAMAAILVAGVLGVGLPLAGRKRRALRTDSAAFLAAKAFAAGVILATGFVHMLHDAQQALSSPCLPAVPWRRFPVAGFVAMAAALATLVLDFLATRFYEAKHRDEAARVKVAAAAALVATSSASDEDITVVTVDAEDERKAPLLQTHCHGHSHGLGHSHSHGQELVQAEGSEGEVSAQVRSIVVSQILEMGIVSHSVIIGLSLGVSRSPCTIRPLVAALAFHQFFEGFALGGCIAQVDLHMHDPREPHLAALKRLLRYLRGTVDYGLLLHRSPSAELVVYTDADWAGCPDTRRSTSGYAVFLGGNLVSWSSKRQPVVSRSSAEAEYRAVANGVAEASWLRQLLAELHSPLSRSTLVYCDNVSAVYLSTNPVQHQRTKHVEIDLHFVRDRVAIGDVRVLHVPTTSQFADIFTKGLPSSTFSEFRSSLNITSG